MKKGTKQNNPTPSADATIAANVAADDALDWLPPAQSEAAQELWLLEQSASAEEFYYRLSEIITDAHVLTFDDRQWLANLVAKSWSKKIGRPINKERYQQAYWNYIRGPMSQGLPPIKRAIAIEDLMSVYGIEYEAAAKLYNNAKKFEGEAPPQKSSAAKKGNK